MTRTTSIALRCLVVLVGTAGGAPGQLDLPQPDAGEQDRLYAERLIAAEPPLHRWRFDGQQLFPPAAHDEPAILQGMLGGGWPAVRRLLDQPRSFTSVYAYGLARLAEQQGALDVALALYERYRAQPLCGLDDIHLRAAQSHALACLRAGRPACYVRLQLGFMEGDADDDRFARLSLTAAGIDVPRFLRGLARRRP